MVKLSNEDKIKSYILSDIHDDVLKNRLIDSLAFASSIDREVTLRYRLRRKLQEVSLKLRYESGEHEATGVKLPYPNDDSDIKNVFKQSNMLALFNNAKAFSNNEIPKPFCFFESAEHSSTYSNFKDNVLLSNGFQISFGEMIAFAGDFYGKPEAPICDARTVTDMKPRFQQSFDTIFRNEASVNEIFAIRRILNIERNSVMTVLGRGDDSIPTILDPQKTYKEPSDVYRYHGMWFTVQYDTILGGYWVKDKPIISGRMLKLAMNNPDHFKPDSINAWSAGHQLAVEKAVEAGKMYATNETQGLRLLNKAYALEGFACHFLTDSFAAGHMR